MSGSGNLKCNRCWTKLLSVAFVTECGHIFCEQDAREAFGGMRELVCPTCDTPLQARAITQVDLANTVKKTLQLCGLPPKVIMDVASKAIEFFCYHKAMEYDFKLERYERQEKDVQAMEKSYQERLIESQNKITMLSHQYETLKDERESSRKELSELKEKYAEKSRQKRKLAELYEQLKKKYGEPTLSGSASNFNSPRSSPIAPASRTGGSLSFGGAFAASQAAPRASSLQPSSSTQRQIFGSTNSSSGSHDRFNFARASSPSPAPRTSHPKPAPPSSPFFTARRDTAEAHTPLPTAKRFRAPGDLGSRGVSNPMLSSV